MEAVPGQSTSRPSILLSLLLLACYSPQHLAAGAGCLTAFTSNGRRYERCTDLPTQGASIAWTLFPHNQTLDIVFSGSLASPSGWIGWGINPEAPGRMVGTRALIAFRDPSGSSTVLPYYIDGAVKAQKVALISRRTDMDVLRAAVELTSSHARIFATLRLPGSNRSASLNHVWNRGLYVQGYSPTIHGTNPDDLASTKTVDMSGRISRRGDGRRNNYSYYRTADLKTAHGILNGLSWGFLLPVGVVSARYLRPFESLDPAWFYLHVMLQLTGYVAGVTGWAIGLRLGKLSDDAVHGFHRNLGTVIFTLGTLQIFALLFRPKKTHRLRKYWKSYHHFVGYACVVVSVVNVFEGIDLLQLSPDSYVKLGYSLVISSLIGVCVVLEINSWVIFLKTRNEEEAAAKMAARSDGRRLGKYGNV